MLNVFQQGQFGRRRVRPVVGLDNYTTGLWATYGLNKMLSTYSGSAVRVRRSSDNAEQDIGFSGNSFNSASLASFVGSDSAFVTTWYDQTGNSRDMLQATTTRQPRIVNAGTPDGKLVFNPSGTDGFLQTSATGSSSVNAKSIFRRVNTRAKNSLQIDFEYGDSAHVDNANCANQIFMLDRNDFPALKLSGRIGSNGSAPGQRIAEYGSTADQNGTANSYVFRKDEATYTTSVLLYAFGSLQTASSGSDFGTVVLTGNFPSYTWTLGARASSASFGSQIDMWNCAIYDADMSASALAINAIMDTL